MAMSNTPKPSPFYLQYIGVGFWQQNSSPQKNFKGREKKNH